MKLIQVSFKEDEKRFVSFPVQLYRDNKTWIQPLDKDIEAIFDPLKNKSFENGVCKRWLLEDNGRTIGRIAAFMASTITESGDAIDQKSGRIGFFECIDDQVAAGILFDAARDWLSDNGASLMDGPVNFGRRDKWWGLLTKGFEVEPNYQSNYNYPYYKELFENYGFRNYYDQYTFLKHIHDPFNPRLERKANMVADNPAYTFEHLKISDLDKYASDIIEVYNKAWVKHEGVGAISTAQGKAILNQLKPIIDEKIIWIAYYEQTPVAIFVNIPEVNQILKYVNGRMDLMGKLKFFWHKKTGRNKKILGMIFGVVPEHQGKGIDGAIIHKTAEVLRDQCDYECIEMSGIGDFNPKMIMVARQVGGKVCKVHTTYRYLFDQDIPFERMKRIR